MVIMAYTMYMYTVVYFLDKSFGIFFDNSLLSI